jgi:hypothetical protein
LLRDLEARARRLGVRCLVGEVLRSNAAMKGLARKAGFGFAGSSRDARIVKIVKDMGAPTAVELAPGATSVRLREERCSLWP